MHAESVARHRRCKIPTCPGLQHDGLEGVMAMPKSAHNCQPVRRGCLEGETDGLWPSEICVCIIREPSPTLHHVPPVNNQSGRISTVFGTYVCLQMPIYGLCNTHSSSSGTQPKCESYPACSGRTSCILKCWGVSRRSMILNAAHL